MSPHNESLKTIKPPFLKFISTIKHYRLNSLGKTGIIFVPQEEIDSDMLDKYVQLLLNNDILNEFNRRNLKELESYNYETDDEFLEESYIEIPSDNGESCYVFSCSTTEDIDEYVKSLYIPGSSNLIIEHYGHVGFRNDHKKEGQICSFNEKESKVLYLLYSNQGEPQKTEDIMRECKLDRNNIKAACNSIRSKLKDNLGYSKKESEKILPKGQHGSYILKIY